MVDMEIHITKKFSMEDPFSMMHWSVQPINTKYEWKDFKWALIIQHHLCAAILAMLLLDATILNHTQYLKNISLMMQSFPSSEEFAMFIS